MKNIIFILLLIAVLGTAYFVLQDDGRTVVSPSSKVSAVKPVTPTPAELSESGLPAADNVNQEPRDPATATTGKLLEPAIRDSVRELVNTSQEGLVEEETGNGVQMNLKGRFRTAPVATVDEHGEVTVRDYTSPPVE
jgi:hypothetical protein